MTFASVVVPTHDRPDAVAETVRHLLGGQPSSLFEIVVVDDGSNPPISLPGDARLRLVRTRGLERSRARNEGACAARGDLLIFVDDDITVATDFVKQHVRAAAEFGDAIGVGRVSLPPESSAAPFGRFRRSIEEQNQDRPRGLVVEANFCTAANMSIRRDMYLSMGGFDPAILSGEDQDLALRFSQRGGRIAYLPEANVIHRDSVADISAYGRRHEWGASALAPLIRRYPERLDNQLRYGLARPLRHSRSPSEATRLLLRLTLSHPWMLGLIRGMTGVGEFVGAGDGVLFSLYRTVLGLHLFRGFRKGLAQVVEAPPLPTPLTSDVGISESD